MSIRLEQIVQTLLTRSSQLSDEEKGKLYKIIVIGNTLIDLWQYLALKHAQGNSEILKQVLDEIFNDLHISVSLAMGGQYKAASVLFRTFTESVLYQLYFIDHPVELHIWANTSERGKADMNFNSILEIITQDYYMYAASKRIADKDKLDKIKQVISDNYRILSEKAHGKYAFLQSTYSGNNQMIDSYASIAYKSIKSFIDLGSSRCNDLEEGKKSIPALERIIYE